MMYLMQNWILIYNCFNPHSSVFTWPHTVSAVTHTDLPKCIPVLASFSLVFCYCFLVILSLDLTFIHFINSAQNLWISVENNVNLDMCKTNLFLKDILLTYLKSCLKTLFSWRTTSENSTLLLIKIVWLRNKQNKIWLSIFDCPSLVNWHTLLLIHFDNRRILKYKQWNTNIYICSHTLPLSRTHNI